MIKVHLTTDQTWRGKLYLAGDRLVPQELAIALGKVPAESPPPPDPTETSPPPTPTSSLPALELINAATDAKGLTPLPGIGEGAAKRIILHRPEAGYASFEQLQELCPELAKSPYRVEWAAIAAWEPESGVPE